MNDFENDFEEVARARWDETHVTPESIIKRFENKTNQEVESILNLACGRELNILVAKYIMGHEVVSDAIMGEVEGIKDVEDGTVWSSIQHYSEDMESAQKVVNRMMEEGYMDALLWHTYGDGKYTPAEAICKKAFVIKVFNSPV